MLFEFSLLFVKKTKHIESAKHTPAAERFWLIDIGMRLKMTYVVILLYLCCKNYQPLPNCLQLILSPICYSCTAIQSEMRSLLGRKLVSPSISFRESPEEKITDVPRKTTHF